MSTVIERLIEAWLDSQTERRYQAAFVQMLVSLGWKVLHSTRHSPIEFGKDVVARNPEGELYAFQLKGNPGSRITKSEAQTLVPQVNELVFVPLPDNFKKIGERHHAVLVTNGEIDEEAQTLFALMAGGISEQAAAKSFKWWGRGDLLANFIRTAGHVWPTSPKGTRTLLNLMASDGRDLPDIMALTDVLIETGPSDSGKMSSSFLNAKVSATLLISEIAKSQWYKEENHYALYQMTIISVMHVSRYIRKDKARRKIVNDYSFIIGSHARDLINEAKDKSFEPSKLWTNGDPLNEVDIMWHRQNLIAECAAYVLLSHADKTLDYDCAYARALVAASLKEPMLWGEGAIPSFIMRYWSVYRWGGIGSDLHLAAVLNHILVINRALSDGAAPLPSPYYNFISCWALSSGVHWLADQTIFQDDFRGRMWMARSIFYMLAKRNMKETCKRLWTAFSSVSHENVDLPSERFWDCKYADEGEIKTELYFAKEWSELLNEILICERRCDFLGDFDTMPWVVAAYIAVSPHRAWEPVIMWLDRKLCKTWY